MKICPACWRKFNDADKANWLPFCSERCKLIDLGAWLNESHRIPTENIDFSQSLEDEEQTKH